MKRLRLKRPRKRLAVCIIISISILGAALIGVYSVSQPVQGRQTAIDKSLLGQQAVTVAKPVKSESTASLQNQYFAIALPAGYQAQGNTTAAPGMLYQQTVIKPSSFGSLIIAIAIKDVPEGGLASDSSYQLRAQQSGRYQAKSLQVKGEPVAIFTDLQTGGVVGFWVHGDKLATISATTGFDNPSGNNSAQLKALTQIADRWQWQN